MAAVARYPRISAFKKIDDFRRHARGLGIEMACDDEILRAPDSPLARPYHLGGMAIGNRFAIQPMEGGS